MKSQAYLMCLLLCVIAQWKYDRQAVNVLNNLHSMNSMHSLYFKIFLYKDIFYF